MKTTLKSRPPCPLCPNDCRDVIKYGFFARRTGRKPRIQRYLCKRCKFVFSSQTGSLTYRERKPHLTQAVMRQLMEATSQRGCRRLLGCSRITVARKLVRLGVRAALHLNARTYRGIAKGAETTVIVDEMETFEHTKCKPISIALAVAGSTREVISVAVAVMPASGNLSSKARSRYGRRRDGRIKAMRHVIAEVARLCPNIAIVKSDKCSRYPKIVSDLLPQSVKHEVYKGRRGCITGQGELKRGGWDPLFTLNHTCAMFRDRIKRLARKTWCTTKRLDRLSHLVNLYAWWHNKLVTGKSLPFHMS